jgi:hypothetical protein
MLAINTGRATKIQVIISQEHFGASNDPTDGSRCTMSTISANMAGVTPVRRLKALLSKV